uniref:Uncharacterized protein n=1 Tax=Spongospora subterranea TaxID=70186 RepID=A0A0H5QRX2_9EUKA|eukprot:CRZ04392.1 hypothetical protein [Spongospora subterranea]
MTATITEPLAATQDLATIQAKLILLQDELVQQQSVNQQLWKENSALKTAQIQSIATSRAQECYQAFLLHNNQKLIVKIARSDTERLYTSMVEDISSFDADINFSNAEILKKMLRVTEMERVQLLELVRDQAKSLATAAEQLAELETDHVEALAAGNRNIDSVRDDYNQAMQKLEEVQGKYDHMFSQKNQLEKELIKGDNEKAKLKTMLKAARDGIIEAQQIDVERSNAILKLEAVIEKVENQHKSKDKSATTELKRRLKSVSEENLLLKEELDSLKNVAAENVDLKERIKTMKATHLESVGQTIKEVETAIESCDRIVSRRKSGLQPRRRYLSRINDDDVDDHDSAADSDFQQNVGRRGRAVPKKKQVKKSIKPIDEDVEDPSLDRPEKRTRLSMDSENVSSIAMQSTSNSQGRKLYNGQSKGTLFANSPGLIRQDKFTDMLKTSGPVTSKGIRPKGRIKMPH